jgi:hypothetical protein
MECEICDPTSSAGAYCDCGNNSVFSFDGRLDQQLGLVSAQVECVDPNPCGDSGLGGAGGEAPVDDPACACGPYDCGPGCGSCPVGGTCISGICVLAGACRVKASTRYDYQPDGRGGLVAVKNELNSCERSAGSIFWFDYVSPTNYIGLDCSFAEEDADRSGACDYLAEFEALSR